MPNHAELGINLSFAVKRWPEPDVWAEIVRERLDLSTVQFTFDLLDPWWPEDLRLDLASQARRACENWGIAIHSAFVGLAAYTYNGLLHPDTATRAAALEWWRRAAGTAAALGAVAVGGPLGGMSVTDAANPGHRDSHYGRMLEAVRAIVDITTAEGLETVLIEPTPLRREIPSTIDEASHLLIDLGETTSGKIRFVVDVGHAGYRPLYGADASAESWVQSLGQWIGLIHLQNHDYVSDAHWGWPDPRGQFDVARFARSLTEQKLEHVPVILEVFYPFELDDAAVHANLISTVEHCRAEFGHGAGAAVTSRHSSTAGGVNGPQS